MNPFTEAARPVGIPTLYKGIRFRSRLEATWATFFDGLGWTWEYEPFDRAGWIPDFGIESAYNSPRPVLVEIKPITAFDRAVADKIWAADREHEILMLGISPLLAKDRFHSSHLGWLRDTWSLEPDIIINEETGEETESPAKSADWSQAQLGRWGSNSLIGFCHEYNDYTDRITGSYDGGHGGANVSTDELHKIWAEAKNTVQWRGARAA